ncbi:DUF3142 domain-containing protein [Erythrobacter sp. SDW2]|uniref:DUF3142 domain-containing protein n=1 Tax=Erythrobacter sp. SDW2 TaxID=2907154 RepID=UPI001F1ACBDE|nr:DUF3142 domain-containing protein [Erythrobacter sp. SDW2]UIP06171.1 DUF3142 domain-containing protein [Erythrobacter sp. SDW2]
MLALLLAGCGAQEQASPSGTVDAADYRAFFLWPGVEPVPQMQGADAVYVLWGELRKADPDRSEVLFQGVPQGRASELWLVVRAERTDWGDGAYSQLLAAAGRWNRDGRLTGIQIDFDSSTGELRGYAAFLARLRQRMPDGLKLSATGLLDWPANASKADLAALAGALDEIVIQTYQGSTTIPEYADYIAAVRRLPMPYRVALVEGGAWEAPPDLSSDPNFKGYVVFLLADKFKR